MLKLLKYFKALDWVLVAVICGLVVGQVMLDLKLPDYMGTIIEQIQDQASTADIWITGIKMLGIALGSVACTVVVSYIAARITAKLAQNIRRGIFTKVNSFSMEEMNKFSESSLLTRTTNDITQVQMVYLMILRFAISAPVMAICAIVKIVDKSWELTAVTAIAIGVLLIMVVTIFLFATPKFKKIQNQTDRLNGVTRENLTGLRVVRAYSAENEQKEKFEDANVNLTKTNLFVNRISSVMMPGMQLVISVLGLVIVWLGAYLIKDGMLLFPDMAVFMQYSMLILMSFLMLSMLFVIIPRGVVSGRRIQEVLDTEVRIRDGEFDGQTEQKGYIQFKNVSFKYPGSQDYVLKKISFTANPGETVAFIGSTGSGKSTLVNLVPRFYDVTEGEVLVDGVDVREYKQDALHDKIGYVPQKSLLFSGTIDENIKYGKNNATDAEVDGALKIAQAGEFVSKIEDGKQHYISQGGKNVSGGQKQRLSIARAIVKNPEIYIFDDSFSALDFKTDKKLRGALSKKTQGATNLIVAQRIGTIMDADKIIVLDKGKVVGMGKHEELLQNCNVYREIAISQLSKEELGI